MSQQLISRSADLKRLRDEGYDVEVKSSYLVIKNVPYVNSKREIKFGTLVSELTLAGDLTTTPSTHVAMFSGDHPCNKDGSDIAQIKHGSAEQKLDRDLVVHHSFSAKPVSGTYKDYYEKMTTYVAIISSPAQAIDPNVTAQTFPVFVSEPEESVFNYIDTASSRADIVGVTRKLELGKIAIVGLGGTGSYILDLAAKTPVKEIHLFDRDKFLQHNAFRSPGAPSVDELRTASSKVAYFAARYSKMHRGIIAHDHHIDASNVDQLGGMDFVFLCVDSGAARKVIVERLEAHGIPFIDVGMGVELVEGSLHGILRVTSSTTKLREHFRKRVSLADVVGDDEYNRNIQIADLNAMNAALAVIKWKKLFGFYGDLETEHHSTYTIDTNMLTSDDHL